MKKVIFTAVAAVCLSAAPAFANVFICKFNTDEGSYIQPEIAFGFNDAGDRAIAFDGIIAAFNESPVQANIVDNSAKKISVVWSVRIKDRQQQWARMNYRLAYFKDTNRAMIRAKPAGYVNDFEERGACQRTNMSLDQLRRIDPRS
ncbi:MAG: hypothetical protein AAF762_13390 [Pseudomonadota bacterium]